MIAWPIVTQLIGCAREQGQVELFVHTPNEAVRKLAVELAATVPGAWQPVPDETLGMITVALAIADNPVVEWNIFRVPKPDGWVAPADDAAQEKAELEAGQALWAIARAELAGERRSQLWTAGAN